MHGVIVMDDEVDGVMTGVTVMDGVDGIIVVGNGLDGVIDNCTIILGCH